MLGGVAVYGLCVSAYRPDSFGQLGKLKGRGDGIMDLLLSFDLIQALQGLEAEAVTQLDLVGTTLAGQGLIGHVQIEAVADSLTGTVRPCERAVRPPDLHGHDLGPPAKLGDEPSGELRVDDDGVVLHQLWAEDAVDVLSQARPGVVEYLTLQP